MKSNPFAAIKVSNVSNAYKNFRKIAMSTKFVKNLKKQREITIKEAKNSLNGLPDSEHHLRRMILKACSKLGYNIKGSNIGRKEIIQIAYEIGITLNYMQATEVIFRARGSKMENSDYFDFEEVIEWFKHNIKILRPKPRNMHTSVDASR